MKKIKLCLIAFFAIVFASMSCAFVATSVKHAEAAVSLESGTFAMDDSGLTLRTNDKVGIRFKVKISSALGDRIKNENITLNFLIAPRAAFDMVNGDYEKLLSKADNTEGASAPARTMQANKEHIFKYNESDEYYWASLVIANAKESNRTLDMSAIAYFTYYDSSIKGNKNRFATTDVEKVRGNLYNVVNSCAVINGYAKDIIGTTNFSWYGTEKYPIKITTTKQAEALKKSGVNLSGKTVLADSLVGVPENFGATVKTVEERFVDENRQEIVLGSDNDTYAIKGMTYDGTVEKATIGGVAVTYKDGNVKLSSEFKNRLAKHGEQTLSVTVKEADDNYIEYKKNLLVVTKEISSFDELKSALYLSVKNNVTVRYGYYRLAKGVNLVAGNWYQSGYDVASLKNDPESGFRGTFDGNGQKIQEFIYEPGIFGHVGRGAVIKNLTITLNQYDSRFMAVGFGMIGATVENVTINANARTSGGVLYDGITDIPKDKHSGLLTSVGAYGNTFKKVTINATAVNVDTLFGSGAYNYSYPENAANTYENCTVNVKSLIGLACTNNTNKTVTTAAGVTGLTVNVPRDDETATDKIIVGQAYGYSLADVAEITAIKLGDSDFTAYTFADGTLTINADAFSSSDTGSKTFVVTAKNDKGYVMNFNLNVTVVVVNPVELDGMREIVLSSGSNFSVDLGEYTNATVLAATLGGENVTYSNETLTVTDEFKANTQKHGNQTLSVIVQKDGTYYNVKTQVLVVTKEINNAADWSVLASDKYTDNKLYGYYRLSGDIGSEYNSAWINGGMDVGYDVEGTKGFKGTLDGNGHTVYAVIMTPGIIGSVGSGAVIKNISIVSAYYDNSYQMVIGPRVAYANFQDVNITVNAYKTGTTPGTAYGLLTQYYCYSSTFTNVTIDVKTPFASLLGASCSEIWTRGNTFSNCTLKYKDDNSLGLYANWKKEDGTLASSYPLSWVSGITVSKKG